MGTHKYMQSIHSKQHLGWIDGLILIGTLILLTFGIDHYSLFEPHEGHFAGVAREMVLRDDWITPYLDGAPYLNKPPLLYWLIATSYSAFGIQEFSARLPISGAAWLGVIVAWQWSRQLWGTSAGRATALFLSTSIGWFIFAHQILIDELLGTLLLSMMYCLWRLLQHPKSRTFFLGTYVLLALAVLAKGILALAFWTVACAAIALTRRRWQILRLLRPLGGLSIVAAIVLPWFIAVERANPGFVQYFLFNENVKRALDTRWPPDYNISKIGAWGYLMVTVIWCIPWILTLLPALYEAWQRWQTRNAIQQHPQTLHHQDALTLLTVLAALPILLFLPLSSRLYYYSIPALPPLAMLAGQWWAILEYGNSERARRWVGWSMTGLGAVIATSLVWLPQSIVDFFPELDQTHGVETIVTVILIGLVVGFIGTGWSLLRRQIAAALVLLWFGFGTSWACVIQGFKTVQDFRSSKTLILKAQHRLGDVDALWIFEGSRELGAAGAMSFYLNPNGVRASDISLSKQPGLGSSLGKRTPGSKPVSPNILLLDDWVPGKPGTAYQTVLVLEDSGANRLPPSFPGPKPKILISKAQMQQYWNHSRPIVFATDFLRMPDNPKDPPTLNLPRDAGSPLLEIGPRKLYGNAIARKLWLQ